VCDDYDYRDPADVHGEEVLDKLLAHATDAEKLAIRSAAVKAGLLWLCQCGDYNPGRAVVCQDVLKCGRSKFADAAITVLNLSRRAHDRLIRAEIGTIADLVAYTPSRLLAETTLDATEVIMIKVTLRRLGLRLASEESA
jgi:hypothetical protein